MSKRLFIDVRFCMEKIFSESGGEEDWIGDVGEQMSTRGDT